jgi:hypothetical protein
VGIELLWPSRSIGNLCRQLVEGLALDDANPDTFRARGL